MKVVFFGTPQIAVPYLEHTAKAHEIVAVVTQPDKPSGRGRTVKAPPVKSRALELGLPVLQPERSAGIAPALKGMEADVSVVVAYGKLLRKDALDHARLGALNVHFSLLPKYRGAAPVPWSLVRGEKATGVTAFWLDEGMDTGPVAGVHETDIGPDEDAASLLPRLARAGLGLLASVLDDAAAGRARREPQSGTACPAPIIRREDARIVPEMTAQEIHNLVRGMVLWPKAFMDLEVGGRRMRVAVLKTAMGDAGPCQGRQRIITAIEKDRGFLVEFDKGSRLWIVSVQPEGKRQMPAADFLNGCRLRVGDRLDLASARP